MLDYPCRVLLIEDEPEDTTNITSILENTHSAFFQGGFELTCAETLSEAKQILCQQEFDVILLDLMLPDSRHINSLQEIQAVASRTPIIVQTALEDEVVAVKALELGGCGYLPKVASECNLLLYAIRSAIERKEQLALIERSQQEQQEQEIDILERLLTEMPQLNSQIGDSLGDRMPDVFSELKERYHELLNRFVRQKVYKVEYDSTHQINILTEQLGYLQASPRDLIELHTAVLKQKQNRLGQRQSKVYLVEGRYLLLELMGKLAAYYRKYYIGLNKINIAYSYQNLSSLD